MTRTEPDLWRIAGPIDPLDEEQLYWANDQGWVDRESADLFAIPDGGPLPDGGRWELVAL